MWVGTDGKHYRSTLAKRAKDACWSCPVVKECLLVALIAPPTDGVYGAHDKAERKALLRQHGGNAYAAVLAAVEHHGQVTSSKESDGAA